MRIKAFPVFFFVYSLPFWGEICIGIKQEMTFKMPKNPYFLEGLVSLNPLPGCFPEPNGGLSAAPHTPNPCFFT